MADTPLLSDTSDSDTTETNEITISVQNEGDNPGNANPTAPEVPAANGRIWEPIMDCIRNSNVLYAYVGNIVTLFCSLPNTWVAITLLLGSAILSFIWSYHARSRQTARDSLALSTDLGPNTRAPATGIMVRVRNWIELARDWIRNSDVPFSYMGNIATLIYSPSQLWRGIALLCGLTTIAFIQTCCNSRAPAQVEPPEPPAHVQAQPEPQPPADFQAQPEPPAHDQAQPEPPAHDQAQPEVQPPAHDQTWVQAPAQVQLRPRRALRRANTL